MLLVLEGDRTHSSFLILQWEQTKCDPPIPKSEILCNPLRTDCSSVERNATFTIISEHTSYSASPSSTKPHKPEAKSNHIEQIQFAVAANRVCCWFKQWKRQKCSEKHPAPQAKQRRKETSWILSHPPTLVGQTSPGLPFGAVFQNGGGVAEAEWLFLSSSPWHDCGNCGIEKKDENYPHFHFQFPFDRKEYDASIAE